MALDAQTQRMIGNVRDRKRTAALLNARKIQREIGYIIRELEAGEIPTSSITTENDRLSMAVSDLATMHELDEIIGADGT